MKKYLLVMAVLFVASVSFGQNVFSDCRTIAQLEAKMKKYLAANTCEQCSTTAYSDAAEIADKILNAVYKDALGKCPAQHKTQFVNGQKAWIDYKTKDYEISGLRANLGSMYYSFIQYRKYNIIKERIEFLFNMKETFEQMKGMYGQ